MALNSQLISDKSDKHIVRYSYQQQGSSYQMLADVAVTKRHQQLDEILIYFYPHFIEGLSKAVFKKTVSCNTPTKLDAIIFAQNMLVIKVQEICAFHTAYACYKCACFLQTFLANNFSDFLYIAGKKNQEFLQSLVAFRYSNISY